MNFDEMIERRNTGCYKWENEELLPLWVADMDFKAPSGVIDVLQDRINHGVFGYTYPTDTYYQSVIHWMKRRHNWEIKKDWIIVTTGVVPILNMIVKLYTNEGDGVLIQRPVYNPFTSVIEDNHRKVIDASLHLQGNRYEIDFIDFEQKIIDHHVKLFILCNPHNPIGRVWTREELIKMGDICLKHQVLMAVDEIHHDLVYKDVIHTTFATLGAPYSQNCITCTAPSKTFNLSGLQVANIIVENEVILNQLRSELENVGLSPTNTFGVLACQAAYDTGEAWLEALLDYLATNKQYVQDFLKERLPMLRMVDCEGTYLLWIDFRKLQLDDSNLDHFLRNNAKLWLNTGKIYGDSGEGFVRLNIACPIKILEQALTQLEQAMNEKYSD